MQEGLLLAVQLAGRADVQAEQAGEREVDLLHLVEVEGVAETAQPLDLLGRSAGSRSRAPAPPRRPGRARCTERPRARRSRSRRTWLVILAARRRLPIGPGPRRLELSAMCGIVGYVGPKQAQDVVIDGLRRLEYRGYDSAGIAVVEGGTVVTSKRAGKLANLEKAIADRPLPASHTGIGHTRWATHGAPNDVNAHPHSGGSGRIALVHNGIIENFAALRARIEADDHVMLSETDTEVASQLLELQVESGVDLTTAMQRVCTQLEGAFTLVAVDGRGPDPGGGRPPQLAARGRRRRGRELRRLRRGGVHRAHPRGARAGPGPGRHDHPRGRRGHRLRRHPGRGPPLPRRLGPLGRREGRPRLVHAQGDLRAAARGRRLAARPPQLRGPAAARRDAALRRRDPRHRQDHHHRVRHVVLRRHGREVRHRALDPDPGRGRARPRSSATATRSSTTPRWSSRSASPARPPTPCRRSGTRAPSARRCWRSATATAPRSRGSPTR